MNVQSKPPLTAAEQALVDTFAERLGELPGNGRVTALRDEFVEALKTGGLPTRKVESWHYTDLRSLLRDVPAHTGAAFPDQLQPLAAGSTALAVLNGQARPLPTLPEGITVRQTAEMLQAGSLDEAIKPRGDDDTVGFINGAFVTGGYALEVADGASVDAPLELQVIHAAGQAHTRFPAVIGRNANVTVVERHRNADGEPALVSSITDLDVKDDATATWIILQEQGGADTHLGQINITLGENARLQLYVINAGGKLVRQEIHAVTRAEGADLQLRGVNLLAGDTHTDVTLTLGHEVPNTTSTETLRNVVFDRARGVFQGQIRVAPDAQKTDARMASNTLLLSDDGEFSTKPELEIFADDVQCAHGATVADIDDVHLFYLMSRGIPEHRARALLIQAFLNEIVEELEHEALVEALHGVIETWLEANG